MLTDWPIFLFGAVQNPLPNGNGIVRERLQNFLKVNCNILGQLFCLAALTEKSV